MANNEIFHSGVRSRGDLAGVFEYDGETGYFYLYDTGKQRGHKILDAIHVISGELDFTDADVVIRWDRPEQKVGLFIRGKLWAAFDGRHRLKYGGNYRFGAQPNLPPEETQNFALE